MKGPEIRQSFLDFFEKKQHQIVDSAPVVPHDDPTLMFTNAGMNQFKAFFLGQATPSNRRIADTQKCIRVSGKHNDLEETGHDTYHHTFFEMLGNWSIGDYYKKEAIEWAWELLTEVWGLPKDRLHATVFGGDELEPCDDEAIALWKEVTDIDHNHIHKCDRKDNFWMMGETGPCGPCSEIHIDLTPDKSGKNLVNKDSPLVIELWNLVFIQYNAEEDGSYRELPAKHVDTGMGLERVAAVIECTEGGKNFDREVSNYDSEIFQPLIRKLAELSGMKYTPGQSSDKLSIAMRVCADHARMVSFSIADGALPSNEGRGYVVRRLLRRAARYGRQLGLTEPFLHRLVEVLVKEMGGTFPELVREQKKIEHVIKAEEVSFNQTLDRGISLFEEAATEVKDVFPGDVAFKLYDTYGFPKDLTDAMARERGLSVDTPEFDRLMAEQKERARAAQTKIVVSALEGELNLPPTPFVGFTDFEESTRIAAVLDGSKDTVDIVLESTPFYAEMGGQLGDTGILKGDGFSLEVLDTVKKEGVVFHRCRKNGAVAEGAMVKAEIDRARRLQLQRHHTATHLLHHALREVLGSDVHQQGSLVAPERLRFDFTHYEGVRAEQLLDIERRINTFVLENSAVSWFEIPIEQKPDSVVAFFGDKYGEVVRVVKIGGQGQGPLGEANFDGYSMELCGGTHCLATGEIGPFRFVSEGAIAAGVRRVEAVCGFASLERLTSEQLTLNSLCEKLATRPSELEKRVDALLENQKHLERELERARQQEAEGLIGRLLDSQKSVETVAVLTSDLGARDPEYLRLVADALRPKFQGIAVLGGTAGGKVSLLALVDGELVKRGYHAGKLIREVAKKVGGGGGGRPDLAQAGGKEPEKLAEALACVPELVKSQSQ